MSRSPHSRPIVCGLDGSDWASASQLASSLAERLGCRLVLVSIADTNYSRNSRNGLPPELADPAQRLVSAAIDHDAQLLVTGSHGPGWFRMGPHGNLSRKIARRAPCPVLVVSPRATEKVRSLTEGRNEHLVLCGLDHAENLRPLMLAIDLSRRLGAKLMIGHAYDDPPPMGTLAPHGAPDWLTSARSRRGRETLERAAMIADYGGATHIETRLLAGDPAQTLLALADRESVDLIVVGSRGRGWIRSALLGSVSSALAGSAPAPVAILPAGARVAPKSGHYEVELGLA